MSSISSSTLCRLGRMAMPLMTPEARAEAEKLISRLSANAAPSKADEVAAAFEADMRPVVGAVVSALEAGDVEAFRGLRAMLPHLLAEVNESAGLQEALGRVLGEALVRGLFSDPTEAQG